MIEGQGRPHAGAHDRGDLRQQRAQVRIHHARRSNAGFNVLADKPMVIRPQDFAALEAAFAAAKEKKVLLYDIMTERFEITTMLQRELSTAEGVVRHARARHARQSVDLQDQRAQLLEGRGGRAAQAAAVVLRSRAAGRRHRRRHDTPGRPGAVGGFPGSDPQARRRQGAVSAPLADEAYARAVRQASRARRRSRTIYRSTWSTARCSRRPTASSRTSSRVSTPRCR